MISLQTRRARRRFSIAMTPALAALTALLSIATSGAQADTTKTLCGPNEKIWFEAAYADDTGKIAVCSTPGGGDNIGTIRVLRLHRVSAGSNQPQPVVIARAKGAERAGVFTIKRYTRPQTTYLKFEFKNNLMTGVIYDAYDNGETSTSLKEIPAGANTTPREIELKPKTEALSLMALEGVVQTLPFDE